MRPPIVVLGGGVIGASWTSLFLAGAKSVAVFDPAPQIERQVRDYIATAWPSLEELGLVVDGAKAYGSGAVGAAAVRAAHRKLAESAASERDGRTARAARLARYADRHVPKPPPWFEVRRR